MPPKAKDVQYKRYCGLGNHELRPPHKTIKDKTMLSFAKHINPEVRSSTLLCGTCFTTLQKIFKVKLKSAIRYHKEKKNASKNTNSISDVSSSQPVVHSSATGSSPFVSSSSLSLQQQTSSSAAKRKRTSPELDSGSSTPAQQVPSDDDDDSSLSLNAVNGTRLPNVQPIPKRRQFVHANKNVMDIYLAGTTGG